MCINQLNYKSHLPLHYNTTTTVHKGEYRTGRVCVSMLEGLRCRYSMKSNRRAIDKRLVEGGRNSHRRAPKRSPSGDTHYQA